MVQYLLNFETRRDVVVRTVILTLVIAIIAGVATSAGYRLLLPALYPHIAGPAYFVAFSLALLLGLPIIGVFFLAGLEINDLNRRLARLAEEDHLTGLLNRRKFVQLVSMPHSDDNPDLVMAQRGALLIIDADNFKQINDKFGHQSGDIALVKMAATLKAAVRGDDLVSRLGGEEFGVFLPHADQTTAMEVAERIRAAINAITFDFGRGDFRISVSIGGTEASRMQQLADCMRQADVLLYAAKQSGRNKTIFAPAGLAAPFQEGSLMDSNRLSGPSRRFRPRQARRA